MQDLCFFGGFTVNPTSAQVHLICISLVTWVPLCEGDSVVSESCDPMAFSPPGSSAHEISQARVLNYKPHERISYVCYSLLHTDS